MSKRGKRLGFLGMVIAIAVVAKGIYGFLKRKKTETFHVNQMFEDI